MYRLYQGVKHNMKRKKEKKKHPLNLKKKVKMNNVTCQQHPRALGGGKKAHSIKQLHNFNFFFNHHILNSQQDNKEKPKLITSKADKADRPTQSLTNITICLQRIGGKV